MGEPFENVTIGIVATQPLYVPRYTRRLLMDGILRALAATLSIPTSAAAKKELLRYQLADGVKLTTLLYTLLGYDPGGKAANWCHLTLSGGVPQ